MALEIRPLDLGSDAEISARHDLRVRSVHATRPDWVPRSVAESAADLRTDWPDEAQLNLVAVADGLLVGFAEARLPRNHNRATAWVGVEVDPPARGRGVGRALTGALEATVPARRTTLLAGIRVPAPDAESHPYRRFAEAMGYRPVQREIVRNLPWPVDPAHLDALDPRPQGYEIATFVGGVPDELRDSLGELKGFIDVDAPTGDVDFEPGPTSRENYAMDLAHDVELGRRRVETIATRDGRVVAFTELVLPALPARDMEQDGTYVHREHRGRQLGLAVKVANLRRVLELDVPYPRVTTGNAATNVWMIGINEQLGFRAADVEFFLRKHR